MLIFLAGLALLIMLLAIGERAGAQVWHGGSSRYFDHCMVCDVRYARPAGLPREVCPQGHRITAVVAEEHTPAGKGIAVIAVCAGFIVVAVLLTVTGIVSSP